MTEKRITQQLLETGEIGLTELEGASLGLPEHSTTIEVELEGDRFGVQWSGRSRLLSGDVLAERLQDYGQVNGLLRLRLADDVFRLNLLPPGTASQFRENLPPRPTIIRNTSKQKAMKRRATVDRQFHTDDEYRWNDDKNRTIGFLSEARKLLGEQLKAAGFDTLDLVELRLQGEELATLDDFEELLAVDVANVDRMPHQEAVARHVLSRLRGRAVLADEVGLGKTIEAGLAIKELTLRGLAKRVLILCPAPLRDQWREEMSQKFDLTFEVAAGRSEIRKQDKLILSLTLARGNIEALTKEPWDIVIVDEAHRAAGSGARKTRDLITSLTTACRYAFFLTATPVQNDLSELYRLVELLRPGTFTSEAEFKRKYVTRDDPRTPNDPAALRRLISSVMIRTTRAQAGVDRVQRRAKDFPVTLGPREHELYAMSVDLLRGVMNSPGDAMRRRSLALRLTASPFSMGTTALRMSERHPEERVRRVLKEIAHRAMDIQHSAREDTALELTHNWAKEHGRVLIFTQHTDTVTGLLRRMEREGLHARSFHGSMSATERAKTIAAFRSGEAPVMISTDAGAEGQNLQFCNCVLNYDLPWNPMRIEQRIGRVDRLTQPRDEVFVANLYARNTVDEHVYHLLALKLRMFELLFGQVTTILGELDDSKAASFETRVMDALFAENDHKMNSLLGQLGTELVDARERASTLIAADSGMSNWMATAHEHREGLTKEGAAELRPEAIEKARMRQRRVQTWVRKVLAALDSQVLHDTGEGDGAFITVQFDEEVSDELGGRTVMHLAFDRIGMEHHPDAELCAVGSPVFDELLGLLRMRGDLHATVPVIPEDIGPSPYRHAESTQLVSRRLIPSGSWSGQATFRATIGEAETTEHIITGELDGHKEVRLERRPLADGESLPVAFGDTAEIIGKFEKQATSQLERLRRERSKQIQTDQATELKRIRTGYTAQIAEAVSSDDRSRLRRALASEERRLDRAPDVRARAKLLAVTLDEDDWLVEENWAGPGGVEARLLYEWGFSEAHEVESDASPNVIKTLALCSKGHWVDEYEVTRCDSCQSHLCSACGEDAVFENCPVCGGACCGRCRATTGGLCHQCGDPERAPDLDREYAVAWRLNRGALLFVGERTAEIVVPGQAESKIVVADHDVDDLARKRIRAYAAHNGLPLDTGLALRDLTSRPLKTSTDNLRIRAKQVSEVELSVVAAQVSSVAIEALDGVPQQEQIAVRGETESGVAKLLTKLRTAAAPPTPPALMVTRRSTFTDLELEVDRLVERQSVVADDGATPVLEERFALLEWNHFSRQKPLLAEVKFLGAHVTIRRRNEGLLVEACFSDSPTVLHKWAAVPEGEHFSDQVAWFSVLDTLGTPGGRVGRAMNEPMEITAAYPSPVQARLLNRSVDRIAEIANIDIDSDVALEVPDRATLTALVGLKASESATEPHPLPIELATGLLARTQQPFTALVRNGFDVGENWQGHGTGHHTYRVFDGIPLAPTLDDIGATASDFGVCRAGHFYEPGTTARCSSCKTMACRACDSVGAMASVECDGCSHQVCRRCLTAEHDVPNVGCLLCGDHACADCGRNPEVNACAICARQVCLSCRVDTTCGSCSRLAPAPELVAALPDELAPFGATVLITSDADATTALIVRGDGVEHATIRHGAVDRWVAFGRDTIDDTYRLGLVASRRFKVQVVPVRRDTHADLNVTEPHFEIDSTQSHFMKWMAESTSIVGRSTESFESRSDNVFALVTDEISSTARLPEAGGPEPREVLSLTRVARRPQTVQLLTGWASEGNACHIVEAGLLVRSFEDDRTWDEIHSWSIPDTLPQWASDAWDPQPAPLAHASFSSTEVIVVKIASLVAVGVRVRHRTAWFTITASPLAPAATLLARSLAIADTADEISAFTDPSKIVRSDVSNAINVQTSTEPVAYPHTAFRARNDVTHDALRAWRPKLEPKAPQLDPIEQNLRKRMESRFGGAVPRALIEIGARTEDVVTVEGGHTWSHQVTLKPGEVDARRIDSNTHSRISEGFIDREGHFAPGTLTCKNCEERICPLCVDTLVHCDCCQVLVCKRCIREPQASLWLCQACSSVRRPNRSQARRHGRLLSTRNMLIGVDRHHEVVVQSTKHQWALRTEDGKSQPIAGPSVSAYLTACLDRPAGD